MAVRLTPIPVNYRCTRCTANFQYPLLIDAYQETEGDTTILNLHPHRIIEVHQCKERK